MQQSDGRRASVSVAGGYMAPATAPTRCFWTHRIAARSAVSVMATQLPVSRYDARLRQTGRTALCRVHFADLVSESVTGSQETPGDTFASLLLTTWNRLRIPPPRPTSGPD